MERLTQREALVKWTVLAATVVALEVIGEESLTHGFRKALEHDRGRYIAVGALVVTGLHLTNLLPEPIDPYQQIANYVERRHNGTPQTG